MEIKSGLAGIFLAFGVSNLLSLFNIPFSIALKINIFGFDFGTFVLAVVSIGIAYYLLKSKN